MVALYFAVTFLMTWAAWFGAGAIAPDAMFAPGVVALVMTAISAGRTGVGALARRLFQADVPSRWYVSAVLYMVTIKLAAAAVHRVVMGAWPPFTREPIVLLVVATVFSTIILGQALAVLWIQPMVPGEDATLRPGPRPSPHVVTFW